MARIIHVSIPDDDWQLWLKFKEIAAREGKISVVLRKLMEDYIKRHGQGNPGFSLDKWLEKSDYVAFPTLGDPPHIATLAKMDRKMLTELKNNAEAYAFQAKYLLSKMHEHQTTHLPFQIPDKHCPFCGQGSE